MKQIHCNKCGNEFETIRKAVGRIICPACGSNESLSIRQVSRTIKTSRRQTKVDRLAIRNAVRTA